MIIQKPKLHKNKQTTFIKQLNIRIEILLNKKKKPIYYFSKMKPRLKHEYFCSHF
jgi:hypothetical protein